MTKQVKKIDAVGTEGAKATTETVEVVADDLSKTEVVEATDKPKRVEVNEDALHQLVARMDALESENKSLKAEMEATADKSRLSNYRNTNAPKKGSIVRLGVLPDDNNNGKPKVVVGWLNMPNNICEKDATGRWYEKQNRIMLMEDGTQLEGAYSDINKHLTHIEATVVGSRTEVDDNGIEQTIYSTVDENGVARDINVRFVNP